MPTPHRTAPSSTRWTQNSRHGSPRCRSRTASSSHSTTPSHTSPQHYGFELVGVVLENVGQEPTAADLAALVEKVRSAGVKAIFSEAQFSPKLTETLAQEAGVTNVVTTLYNDALGPAPADSYIGLMRWNVDQIVPALK